MPDFLALLPFILGIIVAQAIGVGLAWKVDAVSWEQRPDGDSVSLSNFIGLVMLFTPSVYLFWGSSLFPAFVGFAALSLLWLLVVSWVQKRQLNVPFRTAFFGAFVQYGCFCLALCASSFLLIFSLFLTGAWFFLIYLLSAFLANALLSLFRPTIYSTWNAWRQNSRKN